MALASVASEDHYRSWKPTRSTWGTSWTTSWIERDGFYVSSGCPLSTSGFLPQSLHQRQWLGSSSASPVWYTGVPYATGSTWSSDGDSDVGWSSWSWVFTRTSTWLPVTTGSWHYAKE